jgi:Tfp pilus assembly protein PilO
MTPEILGMFYPLTLFVLITVIVVVLLWQGMAIARAKVSGEREEQYRKLAELATTAEQKAADEQQKIAEALEDMRARLAAIEKTLRDVE